MTGTDVERGEGQRSSCPRLEPSYTISQLAELTGMGYQQIYRAMKRGEMAYMLPNGTTRGARIKLNEFLRWEESVTVARSC